MTNFFRMKEGSVKELLKRKYTQLRGVSFA